MYVRMYMYVYMYVCTCMYVCMYYMYVCMYICKYVYHLLSGIGLGTVLTLHGTSFCPEIFRPNIVPTR